MEELLFMFKVLIILLISIMLPKRQKLRVLVRLRREAQEIELKNH